MFALGFEIANLMGWSDIDSVFLGAAMCISSSAILVTMLRESGQLLQIRGRLIVGILVVEDFAAVILLTVLAGVATTGTTDFGGVGAILVKLTAFGVLALVLGASFAHKLVHFVDRFKSEETLLITGLTLCFGLALAAQQLGLSGAAGAFLIGAVLGDSHHAKEMERIVGPIRTMFAAIFFVSIGMLIDLTLVDDFIVPTLVVSVVFVVGKIVSDTVGTFLSGQDGRVSLNVGMGMPQAGEFSLAIVKTGVDFGAVGAFMYPVFTGATAITALAYPLLFRSADPIVNFLERRSPPLLKRYCRGLSLAVGTFSSAFQFNSPRARQIQRSSHVIMVDLAIIAIFSRHRHGQPQVHSPVVGDDSLDGRNDWFTDRRHGAGSLCATGGGHLEVVEDAGGQLGGVLVAELLGTGRQLDQKLLAGGVQRHGVDPDHGGALCLEHPAVHPFAGLGKLERPVCRSYS